MLLAIIGLTVIGFVLCVMHIDDEEISGGICACLAILFVLSLIPTIGLTVGVINGRTLDQKIEMYTEENEKIESQMSELIAQYMDYESSTLGDLKGESSIALISLYPELKADALVAKQTEIYIENNQKIKELKEKAINISNYKWWLYFGG